MKHPHHDVIIAYLEGKEIEVKRNPGVWESVSPWKNHAHDAMLHSFSNYVVYRIKPTPKYRVVFQTSSGMLLVSAEYYESLSAFEDSSGAKGIELIQATRKEE